MENFVGGGGVLFWSDGMCGTVCMGAAGPPNLVWGGTGRVGLLITELQYTDSDQIVVRFVVSLPHHRQKRTKQTTNNK